MHRRTVLGLAASPLLAGLATPSPIAAQTTAGARVLRFVPSAGLTTVDPLWSLATISFTHGYMVWDTLFGIDQNLVPHPQAVDRAEVSPDGLTWVFTLRDGQTFHDGQPVRASDAVASVRRWSKKDPFGQTIAALTAQMAALDDKRFQITLTKPFQQMLFALGARNVFVMPERLANTPVTEQFKEVVGSGPYSFVAEKWQPGAVAHYVRNEKYVPRSEPPDLWAGAKIANFDRVEWTAQPDPSPAAAALQQGEMDWVEQPLLDLLPMLQKNKGVKVEAVDPFGALAILRFNHLLPPFNNPAMRRALLPGIDQQSVVTAVVGDQAQFGRAPVGFFTAGSPMANDAGMAVLTGKRDMAEARRQVAAAGYKGERIVMVAPSDLPAIMAMSEVMQDQLQQMGFNVDFQVTDWGTMVSRMAKKDPVAEGGWNIYCVTWAGLTASTPGSSYPLRANGPNATSGWPTDDVLEALRLKWFDAPDLAAQQAVAREIQERAFVSLPFIPLGQWYNPSAYASSISGVLKSPFTLFWNAKRV